MNPTTLFRDDWLWVVAKPAGVPTQADRAGSPDLAAALSRHTDYLGVHHRLDQPASGVVLFTVHPGANAAIAAAFRDHTIERTYLAVLTGDLDGPEVLDAQCPARRVRRHRGRLRAAVRVPRGRPADSRRCTPPRSGRR